MIQRPQPHATRLVYASAFRAAPNFFRLPNAPLTIESRDSHGGFRRFQFDRGRTVPEMFPRPETSRKRAS